MSNDNRDESGQAANAGSLTPGNENAHTESANVDISINLQGAAEAPERKFSPLQWAAMALGALAMGLLIHHSLTSHHIVAHEGAAHAHAPSLWAVTPFAGLLLCVAILPLIPATEHWWENNKNRLMVSLSFGAVTLVYYWITVGTGRVVQVLEHGIVVEYLPFIVLLFSLYVISGGISLSGDLAAHPATNTGFLAVGALIASVVGTTGASMLLIRPLLKTNCERKHVRHTVIFFIFLVSNVGGCLLPIGDPPLFLGYLRGVPFLWTLHLWAEWAVMCAALLIVYYIWDTIAYKKETIKDIVRDETQVTRLSLAGTPNLLWLLGIVFCVALIQPGKPVPLLGFTAFPFLRELMMLAFVVLSLKSTAPSIRETNKFNYHAIMEVAALFIGIFICMQAPIEILKASGSALGDLLSSPTRFFWATGTLSAFLDNAPTYVVFFETSTSLPHAAGTALVTLADGTSVAEPALVAISLGAVFMGAMSYIGNGPNFMVKSIAESSGVRMPSFFGYMVYSCLILLPLLIVVTTIFL